MRFEILRRATKKTPHTYAKKETRSEKKKAEGARLIS
jgi:hypothetical protein